MRRWSVAICLGLALGFFGAIGTSHGHWIRKHCEPCPPPCAPIEYQSCDCQLGQSTGLVDGRSSETPPSAPAAGGLPPPASSPDFSAPTPPTPSPQPKVHALLLVDDMNSDTGVASSAGAALMAATVRAGVSANRIGTILTLHGSAMTPDRIQAAIRALPVRGQDSLICFYSGAMEYDDNNRTFMLTPAAGRSRISRNDLRSDLLARKARLTVLLTDAPVQRISLEHLQPFQPPTEPISIESLVFDHRGIMDVHASSPTEQAFARGDQGGLFTLAWVHELGRLKSNSPPFAWSEFFDRVRKTTDALYVDLRRAVLTSDKVSDEDKRVYRDQPHQTPMLMTPMDQVQPAPRTTASPTGPRPAELLVRVPSQAKVFIEDRLTTQSGPVRLFETAELSAGRDYTYAVRAQIERSGRIVNEVKRVTVRAGEVAELTFD